MDHTTPLARRPDQREVARQRNRATEPGPGRARRRQQPGGPPAVAAAGVDVHHPRHLGGRGRIGGATEGPERHVADQQGVAVGGQRRAEATRLGALAERQREGMGPVRGQAAMEDPDHPLAAATATGLTNEGVVAGDGDRPAERGPFRRRGGRGKTADRQGDGAQRGQRTDDMTRHEISPREVDLGVRMDVGGGDAASPMVLLRANPDRGSGRFRATHCETTGPRLPSRRPAGRACRRRRGRPPPGWRTGR